MGGFRRYKSSENGATDSSVPTLLITRSLCRLLPSGDGCSRNGQLYRFADALPEPEHPRDRFRGVPGLELRIGPCGVCGPRTGLAVMEWSAPGTLVVALACQDVGIQLSGLCAACELLVYVGSAGTPHADMVGVIELWSFRVALCYGRSYYVGFTLRLTNELKSR